MKSNNWNKFQILLATAFIRSCQTGVAIATVFFCIMTLESGIKALAQMNLDSFIESIPFPTSAPESEPSPEPEVVESEPSPEPEVVESESSPEPEVVESELNSESTGKQTYGAPIPGLW